MMRSATENGRRLSAGFTLLELLIVMALIALLAGISVPVYLGRAEGARQEKVKADFSTIATALSLYKLDNGMLPTTEQGLRALVEKPSLSPRPSHYRQGGYMREVPPDPWGGAYRYLRPSRDGEKEFGLYSLGADGKEGGKDEDADIQY